MESEYHELKALGYYDACINKNRILLGIYLQLQFYAF